MTTDDLKTMTEGELVALITELEEAKEKAEEVLMERLAERRVEEGSQRSQ